MALAAGMFVALHRETPSGPAPGAALFYRQSLVDAAGALRAMDDYRGKVVVVNFWATWCGPCVKEIPAFSATNADVAARSGGRIAFVGLGIDSPDNIAAFADRFKPSYPLLGAAAVGTDLARAFGDAGGELPFTVVLDGRGQLVATHLGQVDAGTLRAWLEPFVASPSDAAIAHVTLAIPAGRPEIAADREGAGCRA